MEMDERTRVGIKIKKKLENEANELSSKISDYFNTYAFKERSEILNKALDREHRTLQQTFTRFMRMRFLHMASENYHTDMRNDDSKDLAKRLKKELDEGDLRMI